jgi:hypothetical protein
MVCLRTLAHVETAAQECSCEDCCSTEASSDESTPAPPFTALGNVLGEDTFREPFLQILQKRRSDKSLCFMEGQDRVERNVSAGSSTFATFTWESHDFSDGEASPSWYSGGKTPSPCATVYERVRGLSFDWSPLSNTCSMDFSRDRTASPFGTPFSNARTRLAAARSELHSSGSHSTRCSARQRGSIPQGTRRAFT